MCKTCSSTIRTVAIGKFYGLYVLKVEPYRGPANCRTAANGPSLAAEISGHRARAPLGQASALSEIVAMTATPRPRFDQWLLAQIDREDPVGDIAREFSEDRSVGCAGDIRTPEQLIGHIERVHHAIDLAIRAVEQARAEYLRGRVDPLRARKLGVRAPGVQKFSGASLPGPFGGREPPSAESTSNQAAAP